jgi:hypothetical protein
MITPADLHFAPHHLFHSRPVAATLLLPERHRSQKPITMRFGSRDCTCVSEVKARIAQEDDAEALR